MPVSPVALDKRLPQPKPIKAQGIYCFGCYIAFITIINVMMNNIARLCICSKYQYIRLPFLHYCVSFLFVFFFCLRQDGKIGNPDRQNNGPVVVKASKDKKKVNLKVILL